MCDSKSVPDRNANGLRDDIATVVADIGRAWALLGACGFPMRDLLVTLSMGTINAVCRLAYLRVYMASRRELRLSETRMEEWSRRIMLETCSDGRHCDDIHVYVLEDDTPGHNSHRPG